MISNITYYILILSTKPEDGNQIQIEKWRTKIWDMEMVLMSWWWVDCWVSMFVPISLSLVSEGKILPGLFFHCITISLASFSKRVMVPILSYENEISFTCKLNAFSYVNNNRHLTNSSIHDVNEPTNGLLTHLHNLTNSRRTSNKLDKQQTDSEPVFKPNHHRLTHHSLSTEQISDTIDWQTLFTWL